MNVICESCKQSVPNTQKFCYACGTLLPQLNLDAVLPKILKTNGPDAPVEPLVHAPVHIQQNRRGLFISIGVLLLITASIGIGVGLGGEKSDETAAPAISAESATVTSQYPGIDETEPVSISTVAEQPSTNTASVPALVTVETIESTPIETILDFESNTQFEKSNSGDAYMQALGSWSTSGFQSMMDLAQPDSAAWSYAYHLFLGRRSERQSGGGDGRPLKVLSSGSTYNICFTSSCSTEISDVTIVDGRVQNFWVNGRSLDESIAIHPLESDVTCGSTGSCVALRSTFWFGGTTYAVVEVGINDPSVKKVRNMSVTFVASDGSRFPMSSGTTPSATPNEKAFYSLGFRNSPAPWGGTIVVELRSSIGTETFRLPV